MSLERVRNVVDDPESLVAINFISGNGVNVVNISLRRLILYVTQNRRQVHLRIVQIVNRVLNCDVFDHHILQHYVVYRLFLRLLPKVRKAIICRERYDTRVSS